MPRKDYCPICGAELISGKTVKMFCPNTMCSFVDRRYGNGVIDPLMDRREGFNRWVSATQTPDPWANERNWFVVKDINSLFAE